jgi:sugar phosphate isomerase/epimerase
LRIGFVTAIAHDSTFEEVLAFAAETGYDIVEPMCWPLGKAERRYAGITHIDVTNFGPAECAVVKALCERYGVGLSALGYYPNPLVGDAAEREVYANHLRAVIDASDLLEVGLVTTFVGRDHEKSLAENMELFEQVWPPLVAYAEEKGVRIAIENCPMLFSGDEWPGGKNLAVSPAIWRRMFEVIPSASFGLNFDPSHLIWQGIDYVRAIGEFGDRLLHVHVKDERVSPDRLYEHGILGLGWHDPKLPGLGDCDWGAFFAALTDVGYRGPVVIEVEDRAYEYGLEGRQRALRQSLRYIEPFIR